MVSLTDRCAQVTTAELHCGNRAQFLSISFVQCKSSSCDQPTKLPHDILAPPKRFKPSAHSLSDSSMINEQQLWQWEEHNLLALYKGTPGHLYRLLKSLWKTQLMDWYQSWCDQRSLSEAFCISLKTPALWRTTEKLRLM